MITLTIASIERAIAARGLWLNWVSLCELEGKHRKRYIWRAHIQNRHEVLVTAEAEDLNVAKRKVYEMLLAKGE